MWLVNFPRIATKCERECLNPALDSGYLSEVTSKMTRDWIHGSGSYLDLFGSTNLLSDPWIFWQTVEDKKKVKTTVKLNRQQKTYNVLK